MKANRRYTLDNKNRLVIKSQKGKFITNGNFGLDKENRLIYWLNEPSAWHKRYDLPRKISWEGNWKLNKNYDLEFSFSETQGQSNKDLLVFKGEIISVDRDELVFEVISQDKEGLTHIQLLKLSGTWQADEYNRLNFVVKKKASPDTLVLGETWFINTNQQISFTCERTHLKRKTKDSYVLIFQGHWQLNQENRLTYILERSTQSKFDFHVQAESNSLYPKEGVIKYRIGIGLRPSPKVISLYGSWKFSRKFALIFEMDYGEGRVHSLEFGANVYFTKKDSIAFSLVNQRKEPLGLSITFTHRFLKQNAADLFLRLKKSRLESAIETEISIPF